MPEESHTPHDVLDFWFGDLDEDGLADESKSKRWWKKDPAFDAEIEERFGALIAAVSGGEHEAWLESPKGSIAYVIVLDQFCRNVHRGTPRMYEDDERAQRAAAHAIEAGFDEILPLAQRSFLYMPFMHSESRETQARCVALFEAMAAKLSGEVSKRIKGHVLAAHAHRRVVDRFGRFPHRNAVLGRECTPEEEAFLKEPGSSF